MNPFEDSEARFLLVEDEPGTRCALWPAAADLPPGWRVCHRGDLDSCREAAGRFRSSESRRGRAAAGAPGGVWDLIERHVVHHPSRPAVVDASGEITYGELGRRVSGVARALVGEGVGPGDVVALMAPRSSDHVVAQLAILRLGATYMPVDIEYPDDRRHLMLELARPGYVVDDGALRRLTAVATTGVEWMSPAAVTAEDDAYLIFTSGSTGTPKGIVMQHGAMINLVRWMESVLPGGPGVRTAQFAAIGFDVSIQETLFALGTGRTLVVPKDAIRRDTEKVLDWLERTAVNELFAPTAVIDALATTALETGARLPALTDVVQAGEALRPGGRFREFARLARFRLHNHYGPAETHVVLAHSLPADPGVWPASVPVGTPVRGTDYRILDDGLSPVPDGDAGELYLSGTQVARGYWARPDLTAQRFVPDPFGPPGTVMYRTGDLVRRGVDGTVEFIGRTDDQVKIRGFRVELGEVEAAILGHPGVSGCAVVARTTRATGTILVAYVVGDASEAEVRAHLVGLPDYLIPSRFVPLEALPLSPNGKVDRKNLPDPGPAATAVEEPRDEVEALYCAAFGEILDLPAVGRNDNFFELGGHSLLATRLTRLLRRRSGTPVPASWLYREPTPSGLATLTRTRQAEPA